MGDLFRRGSVIFVAALVGATTVLSTLAHAQGEPPARVGRLAFAQGTVSFHDREQPGWIPAVVNRPLTSGDAIWTEPNARSEISLSGTRVRMEGASQLDMLAIDDSQTRLQLDQGRIDVKCYAMDTNQPYEILTPRGTAALQQQGDYYMEAGSTQDPTRLGVRAGAAQFQALNGQTVAVRPGEVAEILGDASSPQIRVVNTAPPAPPAYWAARDRQVVYDQPPQYLSAGITGYEDLNAYGSWINDGTYGEVWAPRAVPAGWAPYRTGRWIYQEPWGWSWVDEQPWGFAPYHYGRWANLGGRWVWVPPQRDVRPVYAPALVAFVGGVELAAALTNRSVAPVGWFPLGPREAYVPPYTANQDYYLRMNRSARVQDEILRERWESAQRREAFEAGQRSALMNQRFATVVPTAAFVNSQPVARAALQVPQQRIAAAPVAPVSAPPAPTASIAAAATAGAKAPPPPAAAAPNVAVAKTAVADMPMLAKPTAVETRAIAAPGPKIATTQPNADAAKPAPPPLAPRQGAAPPALRGAVTTVPNQPAKPGETPAPTGAPQPQAKPAEPPKPQAAPAAPPLPAPQQQAKPVEPPKPQAAPAPPATPQQQQQAKPAEPPKPQAAPQPQAAPTAPPPPKPQAQPAPQPAPQAAPAQPPKPQPQTAPPPQPRPAAPPPQQQGNAAPQPQPQPQHAAPPPPPRPAPQQTQAPPPQPQHAAPPPPPRPAPQQTQAPPPQPHPAPQQTQAPPPQAPHPPPQQAQSPQPQPQSHPAPTPQPQQQQPQQKKPDEKK